MSKYYLGIDNGTQGLSVVVCDDELDVVATGEASYDFAPDLEEGCYEHFVKDWDVALEQAMKQVHEKISNLKEKVAAIGISGQMHGEVLIKENNEAIPTARLWCDARNGEEGDELTSLFGTKVPKRSTCARFLWTCRNRPDVANDTQHMTTPAGWTMFRLTNRWALGIGDSSGMFPINQETLDYDERLLEMYEKLMPDSVRSFKSILPDVVIAGEDAGSLSEEAAEWLGLPAGIPVAAGEGDQPAAMAGSLIAEAGTVSMSFGTSVVANLVGSTSFSNPTSGVDHFCAADGKPIHMIWIRNGTTFLNTVVGMYGKVIGSSGFEHIMPEVIASTPNCGGLVALPFMDDEPGLQVKEGGTAMVIGWNPTNTTAGNVAKAALLAPMYNLKLGLAALEEQDATPRTRIVLTGGLTKTPECSQIVADVFDLPVTLFVESGDEGSAWGAAVLAKYRSECCAGSSLKRSWSQFIGSIEQARTQQYAPNPKAVGLYEEHFQKYKNLMEIQQLLEAAMKGDGR